MSVAPKAKFAFKRKTKPSASTVPPPPQISEAAEIMKGSDLPISTSLNTGPSATTTNITLGGQSNRYLTLDSLPHSSLEGGGGHSDLTLSDLDGCILNLLSSSSSGSVITSTQPAGVRHKSTGISAVHVRNVTDSVLFLPADIRGSVILHGLVRCIVMVGCHQVGFFSFSELFLIH